MESKWYDHSHNSSGWYAPTAEMRVETDPTPRPAGFTGAGGWRWRFWRCWC